MQKSDMIFIWIVLFIYNGGVIVLLRRCLDKIDCSEVVRIPVDAALVGKNVGENGTDRDTSYSRVSGLIGSIVLAVFFWALGNLILYKGMSSAHEVQELLDGIGGYLVGGASLFAPYAVSKLSDVFKR